MFDKAFFMSITERATSMNVKMKELFDKSILSGAPAVEATLNDGNTYRLQFASPDWFEEEGFSVAAYRDDERKIRFVFIPYSTVTRVEAYEPSDEVRMPRHVGFQIGKQVK